MSPTTARRDYYAVLEIPPSADLATITNAYKRMALEKHPDRYKAVTQPPNFSW
jgi:curved DNA-binding protein CbpA